MNGDAVPGSTLHEYVAPAGELNRFPYLRRIATPLRRDMARSRITQSSAVVGSMIARTSETRLAGNPPSFACSRTKDSLGAI